MTYNGHGMDEFVPQRSSAYISQYDLHIGELTVRETLAFSARCQGVGPRYGEFSQFMITKSGLVVVLNQLVQIWKLLQRC